MENIQRFAHKVVLITGGASGLGKAAAMQFAHEGAFLTISDINAERLNECTKELSNFTSSVIGIVADNTNKSDIETLVAETVGRYNRIDVLLNSAGIGRGHHQWSDGNWRPMEQLEEDDWDYIVEINLKGTFLIDQGVGRQMISQRSGTIINVASLSGVIANKGLLGHGAYAASKAGVIGLTKVLATEWAQYNVRVNAISPGYMDTGLLARTRSIDGLYDLQMEMTPMRRYGMPEEFATTVAFLASEESSFITGHNLIMDGGYTAW